MKIITNTSPVIFLNKLDSLHLLEKLFESVLVPGGVVRELGETNLPSFVGVVDLPPRGEAFVSGALGRLHRGELEALFLVQETRANFVALDDLLAREKAKELGLRVIGTLGILLLAHKRAFLSSKETREHLTNLVEKHGLYLLPALLKSVRAGLGS